MQDEIWGPDDAQRVHQVKESTVRLWCRKGWLPAWKQGKLWRFKRSDFEQFAFKSNQEVKESSKKVDGYAAFAA